MIKQLPKSFQFSLNFYQNKIVNGDKFILYKDQNLKIVFDRNSNNEYDIENAYIHLISIEPTTEHKNACTEGNTPINGCEPKCNYNHKKNIFRPHEKRIQCIFRANHLINLLLVIDLINNKSPFIRFFEETTKDSHKNLITRCYYEYRNINNEHYVIIFDFKKTYLQFVTAFPVTIKSYKNDLHRKYQKYSSINKKSNH